MSVGLNQMIRKGTISSKDATIAGVGAGALVVLLLVYVVAVQGTLTRQADKLNASIQVKAKELEEANRLAEREEDLQKELDEVEDLVWKFEDRLPTRTEIPRLYERFQIAAEEAGVKVGSIKKKPEVAGATLVTIPYDFSVYGTYHQLAGFINRLEAGSRFMKISKLQIGEQEQGVSNATFTLSTYLFKEKET